eukprot:gene2499-4857_t
MKTFVGLIYLSWLSASCIAYIAEIQSCTEDFTNKSFRSVSTQVRRFLREPGHADSYDKLLITWIGGQPPVLLVKEDSGEVIEEIDLAPYTTDDIHNILTSKGLIRNVQSAPVDDNEEEVAKEKNGDDADLQFSHTVG